jgi:hypothetical protein
MKQLVPVVLATCLCHAVQSQTTTIRFEGLNNPKYSKNYLVDLEGRKFLSSKTPAKGAADVGTININYLSLGTHEFTVYAINENSDVSSKAKNPIYSSKFQLRPGYDVVIAIRGNGDVAMIEKRTNQEAAGSASGEHGESIRQPMNMERFSSLFRLMKEQEQGPGRSSMLSEALDVSTNYFTIFQITSLLSLIQPESDRLALSKKTFTHLVEGANTSSLLELFTIKENIDDLRNHIEANKE